MSNAKMPSQAAIRAALREKFGYRGYKIDNQGGMHAKTDLGWQFKGWVSDAHHLAMTVNLGPLALSEEDFRV